MRMNKKFTYGAPIVIIGTFNVIVRHLTCCYDVLIRFAVTEQKTAKSSCPVNSDV